MKKSLKSSKPVDTPQLLNPDAACILKRAEEDQEPVFALCSRDELAPTVVDLWARIAVEKGVDKAKVIGAMQCADAMRQWQKRNGCKLPD